MAGSSPEPSCRGGGEGMWARWGQLGNIPRETGAAVCEGEQLCSPDGFRAQLSKQRTQRSCGSQPAHLLTPPARALGTGSQLGAPEPRCHQEQHQEPQGWAARPGEPGFSDPGFRGGDEQISTPAQPHRHIPASWGLGMCPCNEGWKPMDVQLYSLEKRRFWGELRAPSSV